MLKRHPQNPIITRTDIPAIAPNLIDVSSVFNPGAVRFDDKTILIFRVQNRGRETYLIKAESDDGLRFRIDSNIIEFNGIDRITDRFHHIYDPRITKIENRYYIMVAIDFNNGCRLGLAETADFEKYNFLGIVSGNDNRNGVLFPEKFNGKYLRLDRPNQLARDGSPTSGNTICLSESDDLLNWRKTADLFEGRYHYWDELIGSGPPPVKTEKGWLLIYHGIATHFASVNIYQAGVALLDLNDPSIVLARGRYNILEPRELYELAGQVPNVVFPSGAVAEEVDEKGFALLNSKLNVYYGAADTSVCLATSTIEELIAACHEGT